MALAETNQQERASAWFFEQALKNNKYWDSEDAFVKDKKNYTKLCTIYPAMRDLNSKAAREWLPKRPHYDGWYVLWSHVWRLDNSYFGKHAG
jgi:hypothetical protein